MFFVYAIYNIDRDKIYIGHTIDINKRLERHNQLLPNKTKSYTSKNSGLWQLIHQEELTTRSEAMKREKELKSYQGRRFVRQLINKR